MTVNVEDTDVYIRPFIPLTLSFMAGIGAGAWAAGHWIVALGGAFAAVFCLAAAYFRARPIRFLPLPLFFFLGYLSLQPWISPVFSSNHVFNYLNGESQIITGRVVEPPTVSRGRIRLILDLEGIGGETTDNAAVKGRIQLTLTGVENTPAPTLGDRIRFKAKLRSFRNFQNPDSFDYARHMAFKGIRARAYANIDKVTLLKGKPGWGHQLMLRARESIARLIDGTVPSSDFQRSRETRAVLKALIIGDRTGITPILQEAVTRTGIGHILAISGLHIGIVAAFFFWIFRWGLSFCPPLLWAGRTRWIAALLTLAPVLVYGFLAGMSPSTQRAVVMVSVFLLTFLSGRRHEPVNTLAIAAFFILIIHPPSLFSISFQLSFVSVLTIIIGLSLYFQPPPSDQSGLAVLWMKIKTLVLVSVLATAGTLPLVACYFNRLSLLGPLSNLILVPMVGFGVLPLGLLSVFLFPLSTPVAAVLMEVAGRILSVALYMVHALASIPFAAVSTVIPSRVEIVLYFALLISIMNLKRYAWGRYVLALVLVALGVDVAYWGYERFWHRDLRVTAVDVGQGTAALVELPGGHIMLIDGGGSFSNDVFDVGRHIIAPFLLRKKIATVDDLILTHPDSDHMNGLVFIAEHFNPTRIICNNESADTQSYRRFMDVVQSNRIAVPAFKTLNRRWRVNGAEMSVLYPPADFMRKKVSDKWRDIDNNSLLMRIRLGRRAFLFTGDIGARAERELISRYPLNLLEADVLIVPHHGSRSSSTAGFIARVNPRIAVISAGYRNRYRMPHASVLDRYHAAGALIYRTDLDGAVTFATDGEALYHFRNREGNSN